MKIEVMPLAPLGANCYLLIDSNNRLILVDPGGEADKLINHIESNALKPHKILLTHGHFDHIGASLAIREKYDTPILAHSADSFLMENATEAGKFFNLNVENVTATHFLDDVTDIDFDTGIKVIHTPGHSPGCVCFYLPKQKIIITGDTLFRSAIGRTDLLGGDSNEIMESISQKIYTLPDEITIFPGHGDQSTIGYEKKFNPYIRG